MDESRSPGSNQVPEDFQTFDLDVNGVVTFEEFKNYTGDPCAVLIKKYSHFFENSFISHNHK